MHNYRLNNSPTPTRVADAYRQLVEELAQNVGGKDGRISKNEASSEPQVAALLALTGKARPKVETIAKKAWSSMLDEATRASGGDGRVSTAESSKMSPIFAKGFERLRAPDLDAVALAEKLGKMAKNMYLGHSDESDHLYESFHVRLDPTQKITMSLLKKVLTWDMENPEEAMEYGTYPKKFDLQFCAEPDFFVPSEDDEPIDQRRAQRVMREFQKDFIEFSAVTSHDGLNTGKIWTVTPRQDDAADAPFYVFGRLPSGDIVGLRAFRTWT